MKKISIFPLIYLMLFILSCNSQPDRSCQTISVSMDNQRKCDDIVSKIDNVCLCASYNKFSKCFEVVTPLGMNIYDSKFKYVKTVHFPDKNEGVAKNHSFFKYIYDIDADRHLLMTSTIAPDPAHLFVYNSKSGKMENDVRPSQKPFGITMQDNSISDSDFFAMPWLDYTFYTIDFKSMQLADCVKLDFGSGAVSVVWMNGDKFSMPFVENVADGIAYSYATDSEIEKYISSRKTNRSALHRRRIQSSELFCRCRARFFIHEGVSKGRINFIINPDRLHFWHTRTAYSIRARRLRCRCHRRCGRARPVR